MLSFVAAPSIKRKLIILHFLPQGSAQSSVKHTARQKIAKCNESLGKRSAKEQRMSTGGRPVVVRKEQSTYEDEGRRSRECLKQMEL